MGSPSLNSFDFHTLEIEAPTIPLHTQPKRECVIWLKGENSGDSHRLAKNLKEVLVDSYGLTAVIVDGQALQSELDEELGRCQDKPEKRIARVAEVTKLLLESGAFTIVSVSPTMANAQRLNHRFFAPYPCIDVTLKSPFSPLKHKQFEKFRHIQTGQQKQAQAQGQPGEAPTFELSMPHLDIRSSTAQIVSYLRDNHLISKS